MPAYPYDTLMRYKRWATNGLTEAIASNLQRIGDPDLILIRRLLDHIQTVDEIFGDNLEGRAHRRRAPRSFELPEFETLARQYTIAVQTGTPVILDDAEIERVRRAFAGYGLRPAAQTSEE